MIWTVLAALVVTYVPGALAFRAPVAGRERRAALRAEERVFWHVILSVAWSLSLVLTLAALDVYTIGRVLTINLLVSGAIVAAWRGSLRLGAAAARPAWTAILAIALVALGAWRFFPQAEYLIGGKDPGTYMNEGFQIARRGSLLIRDETVAAVPPSLRDLFFTPHGSRFYYDNRFMGFFVRNAATGETVGQFPHAYPASIALAYDIGGVAAARAVTGLWGILGLLAVSVLAARLVGPVPAFGAGVLLALNVLQVWWARYPNAEIAMQPLAFAALLAFARAHQDDDRFFAPIAGWLLALLAFLRIETIVVVAGIAAAGLLAWLVDRRAPRAAFLGVAAAGGALALWYYTGPLAAYLSQPVEFMRKIPAWRVAVSAAAAIAGLVALVWLRRRVDARSRAAIPSALIAVALTLTAYAWFLRSPGGKLTDYDAYALRTFTHAYFLVPGLIAALVGFVLVVRRDFWRDPGFILVFAVFTVFFCYKIRIVPDHFWMGRRVLPIVLPGVLIFAAAAALGPYWTGGLRRRVAARSIGALVMVALGWQYTARAAPVVAAHAEYAGLTRYLDSLASRFAETDLVIVESRDVSGSDTHVFAAPLAYLYGKHVLVLESPVPNKDVLEGFLAYARGTYTRTFFVGGGGTNLLSRRIAARPVADERVQLPEYEVTPWHSFPDEERRKDFDYSVYELTLATPTAGPFVLDLGYQDDLHVVRFHAKETTEGRTIRWTGPQCFIAVPNLAGAEQSVSFVMHSGGRPPSAGPARVEVAFDDVPLGTIEVGPGFQTYTLALPADAVRRAAARDDPAQLLLRSTVWVPSETTGGSDDRALGVMIDRVEIR